MKLIEKMAEGMKNEPCADLIPQWTLDMLSRAATKAMLDDMREWNGKRTAPGCPASRYAYLAADLDTYEKERLSENT